MKNLANQVNNSNNNENQQIYRGGEHVRVPQGGKNHRAVIAKNSSSEEEPYKEKVVDHRNRHNHNYQVKVDIPLFFRTMGEDELWIGRSTLTGSSTL